MIFKLNTAENYYNKAEKERLERIGLSFVLIDKDSSFKDMYEFEKATNEDGISPGIEIQIETLEDLLKLCDLSDDGKIIVTRDKIIIYDNYVE